RSRRRAEPGWTWTWPPPSRAGRGARRGDDRAKVGVLPERGELWLPRDGRAAVSRRDRPAQQRERIVGAMVEGRDDRGGRACVGTSLAEGERPLHGLGALRGVPGPCEARGHRRERLVVLRVDAQLLPGENDGAFVGLRGALSLAGAPVGVA